MNLDLKIEANSATIGIIGLGYVGLPILIEFAAAGFKVVGFDVDKQKIEFLSKGKSYIKHIPSAKVAKAVATGRFSATSDFSKLKIPDVVIVCVPTPLDNHREPDLSYVVSSAESISKCLRKEQLVVLESTTYPGTTDEVVLPILEKSGLKAGRDFYLAYSPEREDPGNEKFSTGDIPRVVSGIDKTSCELTAKLYSKIIEKIVPVSSTRTAEAVKLTENIYRAVNIALVNELKIIYSKLGIDVWEVIEAAKTKPFGYTAFYPGPGWGGHCIPIDPFYLTWKAREFEYPTKFIELAGEINTKMPDYVIETIADAFNAIEKSVRGAKILLVGLAYKKDIGDVRESPSFPIYKKLQGLGAKVDYYDPHVPRIPRMRHFPELEGVKCIAWNATKLKKYDAAVIVTDHSQIDYQFLVDNSKLVIDTRNATKNISRGRKKIKKS